MSKKNWKNPAALTLLLLVPGTLSGASDPRPLRPLLDSDQVRAAKEDPLARRVGRDLAALSVEFAEFRKRVGPASAETFRPANRLLPVSDGRVVIDAVAESDAKGLLDALEALGLEGGTRYGRVVSGRLPIAALDELAVVEGLRSARPAYALTLVGAATSQGDAAIRADVARTTYGVDGSGSTVGLISDSFDCARTQTAVDVANDDLPPGVLILDDTACPGADEGRALGQVVHDVAPGAGLAFHTGLGGTANLASGIVQLADAGADVIVDDLFYLNEPFFQDGIVAQAIDGVSARGVSYHSSAGNAARQSFEDVFRPSGTAVISVGGNAHDFDPGPGVDLYQSITIPVGTTVYFVLQWDQPFFAVSGAPGSASDVDFCLLNFANTTAVGCGTFYNVGDDPYEVFVFNNTGTYGTLFNLVIELFEGPAPGLLKYVYFVAAGNDPTVNQFGTSSPTVVGHANAAGAQAVGAAFYFETPEFGTDPALVEPYSSAGGVPILFDLQGDRLMTPEVRDKPEIVCPDGVDTTFFGFEIGDGGGPNFFGTSASAPHAAGMAALLRDYNGALSPSDIHAAMESTALDMDDPATPGFDTGFDFRTGSGFCAADAALGAVPECGDTVVQAPEECDDGNSVDDDACGNDCLLNCGDGDLNPTLEQCDDGNHIDGDGCTATCVVEFCGDGTVNDTVGVELITNGDFESGNFGGWTRTMLPGSSGDFFISGPGGGTPLGARETAPNLAGGSFYAVSAQAGGATLGLEQAFTVPANAVSVELSFQMFVNDYDGGPIVDPVGLDHTGPANQHARVDILASGASDFDTGAGVLSNLFLGVDPSIVVQPNPYTNYYFDIGGVAAAGGTYELRFAQTLNQADMNLGVDNVSVLATTVEECDDGNTNPGDGCSADCRIECTLPGEISGAHFLADKMTLAWNADGAATSYEVLRGRLDELPVGSGAGETCLEPGTGDPTDTIAVDGTVPPAGAGFYFLVRGRNDCGPGSYGFERPPVERVSGICP